MKMQFLVLSKLLHSSSGFLITGYFLFGLGFLHFLIAAPLSYAKTWIISSLVMCFIHHYISFRVKFDATLLEQMGQLLADGDSKETLSQLTQQLDLSLSSLNLISSDKTGREWSIRFQGCMRLFKIQLMIFGLQCIFFAIIILR